MLVISRRSINILINTYILIKYYTAQLSDHPLKETIVIFLRRLVCDNLAKSGNKSILIYELIDEVLFYNIVNLYNSYY